MDDLILYIRALLADDDAMLSIFQDCGKSAVSVKSMDSRAQAAYPRIVLDGDDGELMNQGEDEGPEFYDCEFRLEIVTRKDDYCPDERETLRQIQTRCYELLKVRGITFVGKSGTQWCLTQWRQKSARFLPVTDPLYKRHQTKFAVQLYKTQSQPQ